MLHQRLYYHSFHLSGKNYGPKGVGFGITANIESSQIVFPLMIDKMRLTSPEILAFRHLQVYIIYLKTGTCSCIVIDKLLFEINAFLTKMILSYLPRFKRKYRQMYLLAKEVMYWVYMFRFHQIVPYVAVNWFNIMIQSLKDIAYKMWRRQKQYYRLLLFTNFFSFSKEIHFQQR